ncbi:MAG: hypothetical protein HXX11_09045 [Desulfuromonadales bacterium]|nr:hypothetical protein [Desulfuromonadales bacterium]
MLKHILITIVMATAMLAGAMGTARSSISQPEVVYSGAALNAVEGNSVTIALVGSSSPLASSKVILVRTKRRYVLRVPMDDVGVRLAGAARQGDTAAIFINGVPVVSVVIPKFGTLVSLDLGTRDAAQWAKDHPGDDGSGDMNRNGITDLNEYLNGGDPASCVWNQVDASHAETTVYHQQVLGNCLVDAGSDGKHDLIRVARGTYAGNFTYKSEGIEAVAAYNLTLIGGYDPAGGVERSADPSLTVLSGDTDNDGVGNSSVLVVDTSTNISSGTVHVESLTFKSGKAEKGGAVQARIYQGQLELVGNIIRGNSADSGGGLSLESSDSGSIFLANNIVYGNSAANAAAIRIVSSAAGPVTLLNNTIVENTATAAGDGRSILVKSSAASVDLTNNIVFGTADVDGKEIYINSSGAVIPVTITHNAFDAVSGLLVNSPGFVTDASTIYGAQVFVAPLTSNFRLAPTSSGIDKGNSHTKLPATDVVGAVRVSGANVDLGAYEYHGSVTNPVAVTLTFNGNGSGSVINTSASFSSNIGWSLQFPYNSLLALSANPAENSRFGGWIGCDSVAGTICNLTLNSDRNVQVTFTKDTSYTARVFGTTPTYYPTLQGAYDNQQTEKVIEVWGIDLNESLVCGADNSVTIRGGYDQTYLTRPGVTTLKGLIIGRGTVVLDGIVIR